MKTAPSWPPKSSTVGDDSGSGGGPGGGDPGEGAVQVTFDLTCREVSRGTSGGCTVSISDENGDPVDPSEFHFEWSSSGGAEDSGDGMSRWEGTATGPITVTVDVDDGTFEESRAVGILKRFGWRLPSLASGTHYTVLQADRHGQYDMTATGPTVARGGGPWEGMGYVRTAPTVTGRLCIESAGPAMMSTLEALSGPYAQVRDDMGDAWDRFEMDLDDAGDYARAVSSGNFYLVTGGAWVLGYYSHPDESGLHGC